MMSRAYQSGWNDDYIITVTYWTSSHDMGQRHQRGSAGHNEKRVVVVFFLFFFLFCFFKNMISLHSRMTV